ncbi:hypothetical protein NJ7G_0550 [Natrinema sp. J7-2]|nr:hypothetical protein NJ7G_0550 [Natrinema sp. J7-2]
MSGPAGNPTTTGRSPRGVVDRRVEGVRLVIPVPIAARTAGDRAGKGGAGCGQEPPPWVVPRVSTVSDPA